MSSIDGAYDNAVAESFFATLKCELLDSTRVEAQRGAKLSVSEWIEGQYNPQRGHSSIGYPSPVELSSVTRTNGIAEALPPAPR